MTLSKLTRHLPAWPAALALTAAALLPVAAVAALDSPVTVRLVAPGGTSFGDGPIDEAAVVDTSIGLSAGDAGNEISGFWMLDTEFIHFDGDSIRLRVRAGDDAGGLITGYLGDGGDPARYEISGLNVAGAYIVGLMAYSFDDFATSGLPGDSGLVDPAGFQAELVGGNQLNFQLDPLVFRDRGAGTATAHADFRLDLLTQPVPEPASWALMLAGLAGAAGLAQRRRRTADQPRRAA